MRKRSLIIAVTFLLLYTIVFVGVVSERNGLNEENRSLHQQVAIVNANLELCSLQMEEYELTIYQLEERIKELEAEVEHLENLTEYVYNGEWHYDYTEEDVDILTGVMFGEEEGNTLNAGFAGSVSLNRILSKNFPDSLYDVVYQIVKTDDATYEQYAPRTKAIIQHIIDGTPIPKSLADVPYVPEWYRNLAEILLKYGPICPPEVKYQAHFNQGEVFWEWNGEEFCFG